MSRSVAERTVVLSEGLCKFIPKRFGLFQFIQMLDSLRYVVLFSLYYFKMKL